MKSTVLLSGGLDSTVLLADTVRCGGEVGAVSINYGQRHVRELRAAETVAAYYGVPWEVVDLSALGALLPSALTTDTPVPTGSYSVESLAVTVVPNRNAIFAMVAAGVAAGHGHSEVLLAVHAGDHPVYPDCRPEAIEAMDVLATLTCGVRVRAPYVQMTKYAIVARGRDLEVPLHLTWSCYQGGSEPCGACSTCLEREAALA